MVVRGNHDELLHREYHPLKVLGRPVELVVYPGEYHGFTKPTHLKDRYERYLAWYAKYLKGEGTGHPATETKTAE